MYGICNLSVVPVRKEASDRSEMVTQLLFGEQFEVVGKNKQWRKIRVSYDGYEGWIDEKQFAVLTSDEFKDLNDKSHPLSMDLVQVVDKEGLVFPIVLGSTLPFLKEKLCLLGATPYKFEGHIREPDTFADKSLLVENAHMYLNTPYLWGGRSPFGIDCSGFTQVVYKLSGIKLQRDAFQQAEQGMTLNFIAEAEPGDLAFFDNEEGKIIHVGIVISGSRIIHAAGKVRIDKVDHQGIYNVDTKKYTHKLRVVKRLL